MKLILNTVKKSKVTTEATYLIRLPNYFNIDHIDQVIKKVVKKLPSNEVVTHHQIYGDSALTLEERKQIDTEGRVVKPPIELVVDLS
jgi:hypothetical protein